MDLTTKPPATLRLLLATCAADPTGPLDVCQKALLWQHLHDPWWVPTPETLPTGVSLETVQAWVDGLPTLAKAFVEGLHPEEETLC